ncbi:MAG: histidine kinase [SAR86 cluster bacterium]|uniref:Histidine kinase n=1 Tax=SAR86 cluster bacterium TaxID=2030880 RepID=A0A2A5C833_9GAMM|nr:MAG: histidine kinase [SAR86 cluster bacterium]
MNITVEISMYPLNEDFETRIKSFIEKLNTYADLRITTSATSTIVIGEYQYVMQVLTEMLAWSYAEHGKAVFVSKFIPGYVPE